MTCKKDKLEFRSCAVAISLSPFVEQSAFLVRTAGASWLACLQSPNPNPSVDVSSLFKDSGHSLHIAPLINIRREQNVYRSEGGKNYDNFDELLRKIFRIQM